MFARSNLPLVSLAFLLPALGACVSPHKGDGPTAAELQASRTIVEEFAGELQGALKGAIAERGFVGAVEVCRDEAPEIARRVSQRTGAIVGRVSEKRRNPANAPQPWQEEALALFATEAGDHAAQVEYLGQRDGAVRYMKAIYLAPLCVGCHGENISSGVAQKIAALYPDDLATGYQVGDLRGAFTVVWPAAERGQ